MSDRTVRVTIFRDLYDTKTDKVMCLGSFDELEHLLYQLSAIERANKADSNLISPACYIHGSNRRCNDNVSHWSRWAAMDIDDHDFAPDRLQDEIMNRYGMYRFVCYSTASSTVEAPKFRLVFELTDEIPSPKIRHFWHALNTELNENGDPQTKDLSRMYYIPGEYHGANNFIFSCPDGRPIDPSEMISKHEYHGAHLTPKTFMDRLPTYLQREVIKHRMESMPRASSVHWTGYRDCPFINKTMIDEYRSISHIDGSGRYAMIYRIMASIAISAVRARYPITAPEIVRMIRELDQETANRYNKRNLDVEANRAIEFAYRNM